MDTVLYWDDDDRQNVTDYFSTLRKQENQDFKTLIKSNLRHPLQTLTWYSKLFLALMNGIGIKTDEVLVSYN